MNVQVVWARVQFPLETMKVIPGLKNKYVNNWYAPLSQHQPYSLLSLKDFIPTIDSQCRTISVDQREFSSSLRVYLLFYFQIWTFSSCLTVYPLFSFQIRPLSAPFPALCAKWYNYRTLAIAIKTTRYPLYSKGCDSNTDPLTLIRN